MNLPVAEAHDDNNSQQDPVMEYAVAIDSEEPGQLDQVFKKYGGQDDVMIAFTATYRAFDPGDSYVDQLTRQRTTGKAGV